jgi:phosphoglycerol transferase MdoB-like AlkP superfamily enzyme
MWRVHPAVRRFGDNPRVRAPLLVLGAVVLLSALDRLAVLLGHAERLDGVGTADLARSFAVGLRFDLVAAALLTLPVLVVMSLAPPGWLTCRWFRRGVSTLSAALLAAVTFGCVADYYFFAEFDERLNHKALTYLDQPYTYKVIWEGYPVVPAFLLTAAVLAGVAWCVGRAAFPRQFSDFRTAGRLAWPAVAGMLLALAVRGTLGPKAINPGPAYFSNSPTLAQLTLNPLYTLREAALSMTYRSEDLSEHLALLPDAEALRLAAELIVRPGDRPLNDPDNPLRRLTDTGVPLRNHNVVLVVLESLSWHYVGALGGDARLTPNFSALCEQGVLMERCFAVGDRTTRGFAGIVSAHPDLPGRSVTTRIEAIGNFMTLGHLLRDRGYLTMFVYAGQPMYDHRQAFLRSNGYERLVFEDEFDHHTYRTDLGWCDEDLFDESLQQFDAAAGASDGRPFFATLLTLSFHRPYGIPPGRIESVDPTFRQWKQLDAIRYTDWAIGRFMDEARQAAWFDDTLFVFVADHSGGYAEYPVDAVDYRIPFLMYGPRVLGAPRRVGAVCSQTDVIPTVMSVLGGSYEHCSFGSDVLGRPAEAGMAVLQRSSGELSLVAHDGSVVVLPFGGEPRLFRHAVPATLTPADTTADQAADGRRRELSRRAIAVLQTANYVFEKGAHRTTRARASE